ncbi:heme ABC transporter substrate-binding protein IsdE [Alkalihalobacillus pseudalcaliphilus]|uniref:heme ABC transporter substrate-binding protein IsdE n=1 Tax=Alkalihalobacillus pseudalcaliphilus TaxID=79884 RepID=UPI00064DAF06|nr:heme ABC transporter substrate-binding protein IsdE [Alkalihalobacillus pseudalcaliphilus]KMK78163.1 heme ABC transporter substrate-binding protein [Alkalihalobacillus pseudalcaliphilus]
MKLIGKHIACLCFLFFLISCSSASEDVSEGTVEKELNNEERIIATTVAAAEIFAELNIDLVGVPTTYKGLPERYDGIKEIGNPMSPDMELIKSLSPTHVYSVTTLQSDLEEIFERTNIPASFLNFQSLEDMLLEIEVIGSMHNRSKEAEELIKSLEQQLSQSEQKVEGKQSPKVLILLGVPGSYLVATEHSYIGDLVKRAGGTNIVQGETVEYLASNTEYLQQANPDVILRAAHGMPEEVIEMFDHKFATDDIWKHFDAVKNDRVYDLEEELFPTTGNLAVGRAMDVLVDFLYR